MTSVSKKLFPVSILPQKYHSLFSFEFFNEIQSNIFNLLFNSTKSIIIATPTGSGKTVMAELSIIKNLEDTKNIKKDKMVYLSPLKALTYEKEQDFRKFSQLGIKVETFTGDSFSLNQSESNYKRIRSSDLIVSTIEKFDSLTRKNTFTFLIKSLKLLIIDEIHLLSDPDRGPTLEAVLTRIKLVNPHCRIVGLSATLPNVELIAEWLNAETVFFGEEFRPTKLKKKLITYSPSGNDFKDKYKRIYKSWTIVKKFLPNQTLIFVNSRADTVLTAKKLLDYLSKDHLIQTLDTQVTCQNQRLQELIQSGIAFHHAGLSYNDKQIVEWLFREKKVLVLVATSTLAWGINLPAKVVVIQDYEVRGENFETELISTADLQQMLGRAGRPGFDTSGFGYIIAEEGEIASQIKINFSNQQGIYSVLNEKLDEIILGEIFRKHYTETELEEFFTSTLFWVQNTNPLDQNNFLEDLTRSLNRLESYHVIIKVNDQYRITPLGSLIGQYYIELESGINIAKYCSMRIQTGFLLVYELIKRITLFTDFPIRSSEKKIIKTKEIIDLIKKEENQSLVKVFSILYYKIQDKILPVELLADSYIINHTFTRYWEYFKHVYRFMNGNNYFKNKGTLLDEINLR